MTTEDQPTTPPKIGSVYVASGLPNYKRVRNLYQQLAKNGIDITYDWTTNIVGTEHNIRIRDTKSKSQIALEEIDGLAAADALLVLLPGGRGTHFEFGYYYSKHQGNVVILDEQPIRDTVAFHLLPNVITTMFASVAIDAIANILLHKSK